jgi:hypothetical protein
MYPTADQIAHAIVAACRITGADPLAVVSRETDTPSAANDFPIARARSYSALALAAVFPAMPRAAVDRVIGCQPGSIGVYLGGLNKRIKEGQCSTWYDPEKLLGVVNAIPQASPMRCIFPDCTDGDTSLDAYRACGRCSTTIPEIGQKPLPGPPSTRIGAASPLPSPATRSAADPAPIGRPVQNDALRTPPAPANGYYSAPRPPAPAPPSEFVRFGPKRRLEDELRQAILNTGGRLAGE